MCLVSLLFDDYDGPGLKPARKLRLLIVEDESLIALDLERRLTRAGYEVAGVADNHDDALALFQSRNADLVLMDVNVRGDADGIDIAQSLNKIADVPVIFITAYADDETVRRAAETSAYGYLLKPFDDRTLIATIAVALERHRSDTRLRVLGQAVQHATAGIELIDVRGAQPRTVFCNDAYCAMTKRTREELLSSDPLLPYPAELDENLRLHDALSRRTPFQKNVRGCHANGQEFWAALSLSPVPTGNSQINFMLAFHLDITRQREAEAGLARSQRLELMGRMSAGIAHDFNNILSAVMGYSELALWAAVDQSQKLHLDGVVNAAQRGALLTRKLLDLSTSAKTEWAHGSSDLLQVVQQGYRMGQRLAGDKIKLSLELDSEPMWVSLDSTSLEQVVMNLIDNAKDAMPAGGHVAIAVRRPDEPSGTFEPRQYVRLTVRDNGTGMDEATLARIFEIFFTTKPIRTGIGLSTCKTLVEHAGGTVKAESKPGHGTLITVDFPLAEAPEREPARRAGEQDAGGAVCILVEEDALLRKACAKALIYVGFNVIAVPSGEAACREISEVGSRLALLVCDLTLSGIAARDVFAHARLLSPTAELIATSGDFTRSADENGPNVLLLWKPFSATTLARWALDAIGPTGQSTTDVSPGNQPDVTPAAAAYGPADDAPNLSVLVVDDDRDVRQTLTALLTKRNLQVVQAESGAAALQAARAREFHLAVVDVVLQDGNGLNLLVQLREIDPLMQVLVITGVSSVESAQLAMRGRAAAFLLKPLAPDLFMQEVESALREAQVQRLQRKLLLASSEFQHLIVDLDVTGRRFTESLNLLYMVFQPLVRSHDRSIYAFEALMRSRGPMQNPAELLSAAEVLGRVEELGLRVRQRISDVLAEHPGQFEPIFVNLHPQEFRADLLLRDDEPLRPFASRVVWEVTERAQLSLRDEKISDTVQQLHEAGFRVAIDDLGEGYAGLSLLVSMSPDVAKLDVSLVRGLEASRMKRALVSSLVSVCRRARTLIVAEGIETESEAEMLSKIGCDLLQGYFFARPALPFPEVEPNPASARAGNA